MPEPTPEPAPGPTMTSALAGARIVVAVTAPPSAAFLAGQLAAAVRAGADVWLVTSPSPQVERQCAAEGATYVPLPMRREPAPAADLAALARATALVARIRPDVVNAGTPKAGLVVMLAAAARRVPVRIQTLHGLRYDAAAGAARAALWLAQRASCAAATHHVCVAPSLRDRAVETGLLRAGQGIVLGDGSANGVDVAAYTRTPEVVAAASARRRALGIPGDRPVVGYVGRLAGDKGIATLAAAWDRLADTGAHLIVAGAVDPTDPPPRAALDRLAAASRVHLLGHVADPRDVYAALDVLVLPTLREGMPTALLEAAAMELPAVATRVTGCVDVVVDGETGALVPPRAPAALAAAVRAYLEDPAAARRHAAAARARVIARFGRDRVHAAWVALYARLLAEHASLTS